ncbi:response regulator [Cytobacillus gottheilii]|uniref:response regulator n=1 Tax=Cytobacillus gottheilii TaxID=859144 RepID=UPI001592BBCD|nr:response regulator [Cytobacillus gottheilii]
MKACIIDDEIYAVKMLEKMLKSLKGVEITDSFTDPFAALPKLRIHPPDVIFLDMELGGMHGLQFAEIVLEEQLPIEIIFVSAHPHYALDAFEVSAADYLLKPVTKMRLEKAIAKVREKIQFYQELKKVKRDKQNLHICSFGSLRLVSQNGNEMKWRTKKVKELFAYLWEHKGSSVHKAKIIDEFWPDIDADKAMTLLHTTVYQLRKTLKEAGLENPILLKNDTYSLVADFQSDRQELQELLDQPEPAEKNMMKILKLYKADYLEEEAYFWASQTREDIKQAVQEFLVNYLHKNWEKPTCEDSVEKCLEKLQQLDPYNEQYLILNMNYFSQTNQLSKMLQLYQQIERTYCSELGIDIPCKIVDTYNSRFQAAKVAASES